MIEFSVIIPNYNHSAFLKERIESVIGQKKLPAEIIILDDASTDESRKIIDGYKDHPLVKHIVYNEKNSGSPFLQWAQGIRIAASPWIWIAESDDWCTNEFLQEAELLIQEDHSTGMFYCDSFCETVRGKKPDYKTYAEAKNKFFQTSRWSDPYENEGKNEVDHYMKWFCTMNNASAVVFRKDLLVEHLQKLESFIYHGDWFCQLAVACRTSIAYSSTPMNHFRIHSGSFLAHTNKLQSKLECFRILDFLYELDFVDSKKELVDFFTLQYLGFGFFADGFGFGKKLFRSYSAINPSLSKKVYRSLWLQKFTGKKHKNIF